MQIQKRSIAIYVVLNCLTLGIYGFIVGNQIDKEINALCRGDGEKPKCGYGAAVILRGIAPLTGITLGLIIGLASGDMLGRGVYSFLMLDVKAIYVFLSMLVYGLLFTAFGTFISGIYLTYWWYKQASRLKLNAYRYGLVVKESGTDHFLYRTVLEIFFIPVTVILIALACSAPSFILWLISMADSVGAMVFLAIMLFTFAVPLMLFGSELTVGSTFSMFFIFKTLNRYADVYRNGALPFDPMGYPYYPSVQNKYPAVGYRLADGTAFNPPQVVVQAPAELFDDINKKGRGNNTTNPCGLLFGVLGSCAGYSFNLNPGEEIIIGKDPSVAAVIIDPAYKEISRKHVGVRYDIMKGQYCVIDYSSNGTWASGTRLEKEKPVYLPHGTELKLANDKNIFRLG